MIKVYLRNKKTGESRVYEHEFAFHEYLWTEGNYSCDCNRSIFLYDLDVDDAWECNNGPNVIAIDKVEDETGEVVFKIEGIMNGSANKKS